MSDKRVSAAQALAGIKNGQRLAVGGMTLYRRPTALVRALLRQGTRDLTLIAFTGGLECDLLVGAGRCRQVHSCYFGLESFGLAPQFTKLASAGSIEVVEETEATLSWGLRATIAGTGFMPARILFGTDILTTARPDLREVECPYTGERYVAVPPLSVDVALIHAVKADAAGNAVLGGEYVVDKELALAARQVIVSAEHIVETSDLGQGQVDILGHSVSAVVPAPRGAWPTSCYPEYPLDGAEVLRYVETCQEGQFDTYLEEFLTGE